MQVSVFKVDELSAPQRARWAYLQACTPDFASPLFSPQFALLIARYRPDTCVAVAREDGREVAFFGFHPTSNGYARAIGSPFADYQAVVSEAGIVLDGYAFLQAAGITRFIASGLVDPFGLFPKQGLSSVEAYRITLPNGSAAKTEELRVGNPKWAKNVRRLTSKMSRELGPIRLIGHDTNQETFNSLLSLKVAQFHQSGMTDVLRPAWVKGFMQELFEMREPDFGGFLISLHAGDYLVAGQFGVRQGDWFHPWVASICPLSHAFSPGIVFLSELVAQAGHYGLKTIDMSSGGDRYKNQFCRAPILVAEGSLCAQSGQIFGGHSGPIATIARRLELIASVEPDLAGRLHAIGMAALAVPRRFAHKKSAA